jgi:hypothetical protein
MANAPAPFFSPRGAEAEEEEGASSHGRYIFVKQKQIQHTTESQVAIEENKAKTADKSLLAT